MIPSWPGYAQNGRALYGTFVIACIMGFWHYGLMRFDAAPRGDRPLFSTRRGFEGPRGDGEAARHCLALRPIEEAYLQGTRTRITPLISRRTSCRAPASYGEEDIYTLMRAAFEFPARCAGRAL